MAEVLSYWSKRRGEAVKKYWEFLLEGIGEVHREEYYEVEEQRCLGEEEFIEQVEKERQETVEDVSGPGMHGRGCGGNRPAVGQGCGRDFGGGRGREGSRIRAKAGYVGREVGGLRLVEMVGYLRRDLATLSIGIRKLEERMKREVEIKRQVERLCLDVKRGRKRKYKIIKA